MSDPVFRLASPTPNSLDFVQIPARNIEDELKKRYKLVQYSLMREIHDVKKVPEMNMTRRDSYNDLFQAVDGAILLYCVFIFSMTIFYHMMLEYAKWSSFKESPQKQYII